MAIDAVEVQVNTFAGVGRGQQKRFAIPAFAAPGELARVGIALGFVGPLMAQSCGKCTGAQAESSKATASAPNWAPCPKRQPPLKFSVRLCA